MTHSDRNTSTATSFNMKTSSRPPMSSPHSHQSHHNRHSQSNSQAFRTSNNKSTTPMASPRMPHSVGQAYPPRLSPAMVSDFRAPSPNYFGLNIESTAEQRDSAALPQENWSPPTSSVKPFGAAMPKQLPLDTNPEFEAFRRQADANRGMSFSLGNSHFAPVQPLPPSSMRPRAPRRPTNQSESASEVSMSRPPLGKSRDTNGSRMDVDSDSLHDSAYVSSDSKRNSEASLNPPSFFDMPRHESPAQSDSAFQPIRRSNLSKVEGAHPRLSLPQQSPGVGADVVKPRSETLPPSLESGPGLMMPDQLSDIIENRKDHEFLLLDVRVSSHYAQSRIRGALNLCIPTTLLKRATFDLQKLQKTLHAEEDQERFSRWEDVKCLIIYDGFSSEKRDAHSAMNMFKKFTKEGYTGDTYLLRGGFNAFAGSHAELIDNRSEAERAGKLANSSDTGLPTFAPVIGGVSLPTTGYSANPFFGNIRQNMDLADGVGQMDVAVPPNLDPSSLPQWLRNASTSSDHGKAVADKFLKIERSEQSRMRDAYSSFNMATQNVETGKVLLSGIEKGGKNRYKDILPFDHTRVRLAGRPDGTCDYINASHIRSSRSKKHYIASQGPLPATFDDFWSTIWEQDVRVIVMLTAESEGGQLKCHPYWRNKEFGSIKLKPLSEKKVSLDIDKHRSGSQATPSSISSNASSLSDLGRRRANTTTTVDASTPNTQLPQNQSESPYVVIRKFALSHTAHPFAPVREISQLHYPSWPDFGAPAQPSHLLALVELANVMQRSARPVDANGIVASTTMHWIDEPESDACARPMLVHCSAGCGRTGTFCTVDSVVDMLKQQRLASVATSKQHDSDDDVVMDEEPLSPLSASQYLSAKRKGCSSDDTNTLPKSTLGRSGGESGVDVSWLGDDSLDLIERTVEEFRGQRLSMVQSLRQFVLCYETVLEWVWRLQQRKSRAGTRGRARSGSLEAPSRR